MKNFSYLIKSIFLFFAIAASYSTVKAQLGSSITYKAIDSTQYEVTLTIYRDCSSLPAGSTATIEVFGKSNGAFKASLTKTSTTDITGLNPNCPQKSSCNGGAFPYGIEEIVYKDTVNISGGGCEYSFRYSRCCRPSYITIGLGGSNHFNEATVNKCYGLNSSATTRRIRNIIPTGKDFKGHIFAEDTIDTQDSVSYHLVKALTGPTTQASYAGVYDYNRPITFLGFPNISLGLPAGFHFNELTSELAFRPTKLNESTIFCFEAIEFRKVNGIMTKVGSTRLEYVVLVINSLNNKVPYIEGKSAVACSGATTTITFEAKDFDKNDSTFLDIEGLPAGATVNYSRNGTKALATVSWTPTKSDIRTKPYTFSVTATDNACPMNGVATKAYSFTVREAPSANDIKITSKTVKCSSAEIILDIDSNIIAPIIDITDEDSISFTYHLFTHQDTSRLYFKGSGWKKFFVKVRNQNFCDFVLVDSVFITPQYSLQLNTKNDSAICPNANITLFSNPTNGTAPFNYLWRNRFTKNVLTDSSHYFTKADTLAIYTNVLVADANECVGIDTVNINVYSPTTIEAEDDEVETCPNAPFMLRAKYISGPQVAQYNWLGVDTLATLTTQVANTTTLLVNATNIYGCSVLDSTEIKVWPVGVDAGSYAPICKNGSIVLTANNTAGNLPFKFEWLNSGTKNQNLNISPNNDSAFIIKLEDGRGCIAYDTAKITLIPSTQYQLPTNVTTCAGVPLQLSVNNVVGQGPFMFAWQNVIGSDSSTTLLLQQSKSIAVDIFDSNSCKVSDIIPVTVNQNPEAKLGSDKVVCQGTSEKLRAFVIGGKKPLNYQWSNGSKADSLLLTITTPTTISLLVTDANGCEDRDAITFDTLPRQKPILTPINNPFCEDAAPIGLKSIPNTGIWTGAGVNGKIFNPKTAGAGVHPLRFDFLSIYNCPEQGEIYAVVKQVPQPDFTVDKTKGVPNTPFVFTNITSADTTYTSEWSMGDGSGLLTTQSVNHTYTSVGKYTVTLKVDNGVCAVKTITKSNLIEIDSIINFIPSAEKLILNIFPSPASQIINIVANQPMEKVELTDVLGKRVISQASFGKQQSISVQHIHAGIYYLTVELKSGEKQVNKILITH